MAICKSFDFDRSQDSKQILCGFLRTCITGFLQEEFISHHPTSNTSTSVEKIKQNMQMIGTMA